MKNPDNAKERGLIKGALRRVFSRSEKRRKALAASEVSHIDPSRKRVTRWSKCPECKELVPTYLMEVDHELPIIRPDETLEALSWDEVINRIWCDERNLRAICKPCHLVKTKAENSERRRIKKQGKNK